MIEFFLKMIPPTITNQEHKVAVKNGKPIFYEPQELKTAKAKLTDSLIGHVPPQKISGPVRLVVKWCFPAAGHLDGSWKVTKPDTDNLEKMLKDCMTVVGFWKDDAQVVSEIVEKFWADIPGIYIRIDELRGMCS